MASSPFPAVFKITFTKAAGLGSLTYDSKSNQLKVESIYRPRWPTSEVELVETKSPPLGIIRKRPKPGFVLKPAPERWRLLWVLADKAAIWGIRGTDAYHGHEDGCGWEVEIKNGENVLRTEITVGENENQWELFDAGCRALAGESRFGVLDHVDSFLCEDELWTEKELIKHRDSGSRDATTEEILQELIDLWDYAMTPPNGSPPATLDDWEKTAEYWADQEDIRRHKTCDEVAQSLRNQASA